MLSVSSQDFRNTYEKFYNEIRKYLWPYDVLVQLANVENEIYAAFINIDKLGFYFNKLRSSMRDVLKDDELLSKYTHRLEDLINDSNASSYFRLPRVNEVNPEVSKQLKTTSEEEEEIV